MKATVYSFIIFGLLNTGHLSAKIHDVTKFGAVSDGKILNTAVLQNVIDQCAHESGGTVYFPAGKYLTGTLILKSNITLHLEAGATLLGSTDLKDYPVYTPAFRSYTDVNYTDKSLIYAEGKHRITIKGRGTIDGQGGASSFQFNGGSKTYKKRPYLIRMIECNNITLRDIILKDSPMWVQHYLACENINIDGITVYSHANLNNDGIDIDCCKNVRISNCDINSQDDAIVIKSTAPKPSEQITVTNCVLSSYCNAIKCGTESTGGFKQITINNCTIYNTRLAGIALEMVDGGQLNQILISNITMENVKGGIFIRLGNRARPYLSTGLGGSKEPQFQASPEHESVGMGSLKNVIISNVTASGISNLGCSITGLKGFPVENITLENLILSFDGGGEKSLIHRNIPEREASYPEHSMFGSLPAYGFYIRHAKNIRLDNIKMTYVAPEERPALFCEDIDGLTLIDIDTEPSADGSDNVLLKQVKNSISRP